LGKLFSWFVLHRRQISIEEPWGENVFGVNFKNDERATEAEKNRIRALGYAGTLTNRSPDRFFTDGTGHVRRLGGRKDVLFERKEVN